MDTLEGEETEHVRDDYTSAMYDILCRHAFTSKFTPSNYLLPLDILPSVFPAFANVVIIRQ